MKANRKFAALSLVTVAALTLSACSEEAGAAEPIIEPTPTAVEVVEPTPEPVIAEETEPEPEAVAEPNPLEELLLGSWNLDGEGDFLSFYQSETHGETWNWGWWGRGTTPIRWYLDGDRIFWNNFNNIGEERDMFLEFQVDFDGADTMIWTWLASDFEPDFDPADHEPWVLSRTTMSEDVLASEADLLAQIQGAWLPAQYDTVWFTGSSSEGNFGAGWAGANPHIIFASDGDQLTFYVAGELFGDVWDTPGGNLTVIGNTIWSINPTHIWDWWNIIEVTPETLVLELDGYTETFNRYHGER